MKKLLVILLIMSVGQTINAKTTYIPTYSSYIHIVNGKDTLSATSNLSELEMLEVNGMFRVTIVHEDVTKEKVKAIKRAKLAAGLMAFSAVMSGVSTAFSNNRLQYMVRSTNTRIAGTLADIYKTNADAEQVLNVDLWIDNTTDGELMLNDMERGLTWYILPRQSMKIKIQNPDAVLLRISDTKNEVVRYVTAAAGSSVKKWDIGYEDENCWIVILYKENEIHKSDNILGYRKISKVDFVETEITTDEYRAFKKQKK